MKNQNCEMIPLDSLKPKEKAIIRGFSRNTDEENYLMEMGLTIGTSIKLIKFAPFGDPIEIRVRGYHLSIRCSAASSILMTKEVE